MMVVFVRSVKGSITPPWTLCNHRLCCFVDTFGAYSLHSFLKANIRDVDKKAWWLPIFKQDKYFNTEAWRRELLKTAKQWYQEASVLLDRPSYIQKYWCMKLAVPPEVTNVYIAWLKWFVEFAQKVYDLEAEVDIWGIP